jgi:hypothetical protein
LDSDVLASQALAAKRDDALRHRLICLCER